MEQEHQLLPGKPGQFLGYHHMLCPTETGNVWHYGANYYAVFSFDFWVPPFHRSRNLESVPSGQFLVADAFQNEIRNPNYGTFAFVVDTDGDGVADAFNLGWPYNGFSPRHGGGGNFLFADGRVERRPKTDLVAAPLSENELWGRYERP